MKKKLLFTLKLEADGGVIVDIFTEGLRIAKQLHVCVETKINGVVVTIDPYQTVDEIMEDYRISSA